TAAADSGCIGEGDILRIAARILMDSDQAGYAAATDIFGAHRMARSLGRDHEHVYRGLRLDEIEMDVEAMCEGQRCAITDIIADVSFPDRRLMFIGGEDHDDVGPRGGILGGHHAEACTFRLLR